jgi:hypothetical protein
MGNVSLVNIASVVQNVGELARPAIKEDFPCQVVAVLYPGVPSTLTQSTIYVLSLSQFIDHCTNDCESVVL